MKITKIYKKNIKEKMVTKQTQQKDTYSREEFSQKKTSKTGLIVFCLVIGLSLFISGVNILLNIKVNMKGNGKSHFQDTGLSFLSQKRKPLKLPKTSTKGYIAQIFIEGTIEEENQTYCQQWLLDTIEELKEDKKNKGMMLYIDSPGGAVYQADEVYLALQDYKKEKKPIYAYLASCAASGGYYIACSADKIYANRNCLTGSIGVICGSFVDATKLLEKIGIRTATIYQGENKNMGNPSAPFTQEQQDIMQEIANECYEQFVDIVATSRYMTIQEVKKIADGRIYSATQAKKLGLIDEISNTLEDATNQMMQQEFKQKLSTLPCKVDSKLSIYDYIIGAKKDISSLLAFLKIGRIKTPPLQYLWQQ